MEEEIDTLTDQVDEGQNGSLFMSENTDLKLSFDGEKFEYFSYLWGIFIYILLVIEEKRTKTFDYEDLGNTASLAFHFQFVQDVGVDIDSIEGRGWYE